MRFAECTCRECDLDFKIAFSNSHPQVIHCPQCKSILIKINWIDRAGFNELINDES